jgi:hypothetical protein
MRPDPNFGHKEIVTEIIRGVADTVASKPGLSPERQASAVQTVVCSVMAFIPRDPVETMMAGHCIVYDHMLRDGARDMLGGKAELEMIKARPGVLACGKMFLATVAMLIRMQRRPEQTLAFGRPIEEAPEQSAAETEAPPVTAEEDAAEPPIQSREASSIPRAARSQVRDAATKRERQPMQPSNIASARQPAEAEIISPPGPTVSAPHQQQLAYPLMTPEVEAILFNGIDEKTKQEVMAVAAQAVREFEAGNAGR